MKLWDCWNIPSMYEGRASSRAACWNIPFMYEFRPWRIWRQPLGRGMSPCCRRPSGHGRQHAWKQPLVSGVPPRCGQPSGPGAFGANRRATRRHSVAASRGRHSIGASCPAAGAPQRRWQPSDRQPSGPTAFAGRRQVAGAADRIFAQRGYGAAALDT